MDLKKTVQAFVIASSALGLLATVGCAKNTEHSTHTEGTDTEGY